MKDRFINIKLNFQTLDIYFVRKAIVKAIQTNRFLFKGKLLDVGCGKMPYKALIKQHNEVDYIGLDIATARDYGGPQPDISWDGISMPIEAATFDVAMATEVLEHCPDPNQTLSEIARVLKPGGALFFTVPFLWPLHETPYDHYRYTPFSLTKLLSDNGFTDIHIQATGGWNATLGQMLGLWCRRNIKNRIIKDVCSLCLWPILYLLYKTDKPATIFTENTIYPSLTGTARKR